MKLVACVGQNWEIGKGNELLFHISHDMKRFVHLTMGGLCIMGSKTFYSLPGIKEGIQKGFVEPLKGRKCLVISKDYKQIERDYPNVFAVPSIYEALEIAEQYDTDKVYVIGGEAIYKEMYQYCDKAYITYVRKECPDADKFMVRLDEELYWYMNTESDIFKTEKGIEYSFMKFSNSRKISDN